MIGLTNDDPATKTPVFKKSYTVCGQFKGTVPAGAQANVRCAWRHRRAPDIFRYVIVQGSHATPEALCLSEVNVRAFVRRGKQQMQSSSSHARHTIVMANGDAAIKIGVPKHRYSESIDKIIIWHA